MGFDFSGDPEKIWDFPVMTVSQTERSYDLNYQSTCVFPIWRLNLTPGKEQTLSIT
ncbi:MAG: DUF1926 domain-containing protein, partial [Candidatus Omnitrophica bacterium]|nr:DUF1926 domain-containing protein [Candidatus Omnitrophota bacterium]